jgi:hypothetical protein
MMPRAGASPSQLGAALVAAGSAGVVVASGFYAASPPAAALPGPFELVAAREGALRGASFLHAAGTAGVCGDVLLVIGAALVAAGLLRRGVMGAAAGWLAIALGTAFFIPVDTLGGFVLGPLAAHAGDGAAFTLAKRVFDALFLFGTLTFGAGMLVALDDSAPRLRAASRVLGLVATVGAAAGLLGASVAQPVGLSVAASAALYTLVGARLARAASLTSRR